MEFESEMLKILIRFRPEQDYENFTSLFVGKT